MLQKISTSLAKEKIKCFTVSRNIKQHKLLKNTDDKKKCFLSTKSANENDF